MASSHPIRVLLADDHAVVRKGIRDFLEEDEQLCVIAEANDGQEALELMARQVPDVAVLDIQMPRLNGLETARRIKDKFPNVSILILTAFDDHPFIFAALQAGASGYLLKTSSSDEIVQAVRAVAEGETALSPSIAKKLVQRASGEVVEGEAPDPLTEREAQVLRLAAQGLGNKQIGAELELSDRTVQGHLANIYSKLRVATRTEAVLLAVRNKWIKLEQPADSRGNTRGD